MFLIHCACGARLKLPPQHIGRALSCPRCKAVLRAISGSADSESFHTRLTIEQGPQRRGEQWLIAGEDAIDLAAAASLPALHARLIRTIRGGWMIEPTSPDADLHINGQKRDWAELHDQDRLQIGPFTLFFSHEQEVVDLAGHEIKPTQEETAPAADGNYALAPEERWVRQLPMAEIVDELPPQPAIPLLGAPCPSCGRKLPIGSVLCVHCGIDLRSGRAIVVSKGLDEEALAERTNLWLHIVSWIVPVGISPVASEAFGTRRAVAIWVIAAITILASALYLPLEYGWIEPGARARNLMMWSGSRQATQRMIDAAHQDIERARAEARSQWEKSRTRQPAPALRLPRSVSPRYRPWPPRPAVPDQFDDAPFDDLHARLNQIAAGSFPADASFHPYQLLTSALLHGGILHLAGNLLFMLVFGLRVNELVGNWKLAVLYPLLAIGAGLTDHFMNRNGPLTAELGASGAIMGLAGMYFVFFPVQKVHVAIWLRVYLVLKGVFFKLFRMRGFWLLLAWIAFNDLLPMVLGSRDHIGHWAHLGGFIIGASLALLLLLTRQVTARGADLISVALGKRAWALVGRPG